MRHKILVFRRYLPWLILLLAVDGFAAFLLWLAEAEAFRALLGIILLVTALLFAGTLLLINRKETKKIRAFREFLDEPEAMQEENLLMAVSASEEEDVRLLGNVLRMYRLELGRAGTDLADYEEYVEVWAHETKTPLSLLTLILDNRSDEMSPEVRHKLDHVRNRLQENVSQMLYYARVKGTTKDYLFEQVDLGECMEEVLEDYRPLLEETGFQIRGLTGENIVFTDRRGILFLLGQAVSNAVKYCSHSPELVITMEDQESGKILSVRDNGIGVRGCDLPYIFEKGFTGETDDNRKKATGMGLYLAKKIADDLKIELEARSEAGQGFELRIFFPNVKKAGQ